MVTASEAPRTLREAQVALTRTHIVDAAGELFRASGYTRTSINEIAAKAGVSAQTIYNAVGNKAAVLSAVLDAAVSGPEAPRPVPEFMAERAHRAADAAAIADLLADWFVEVHARSAETWRIIREAAAVDEGAAELARARDVQRLHNYRLAAAELRSRGELGDMSDDEAAATIWSIGNPLTYLTLVGQLGWSHEAYRAWVCKALAGGLGVGGAAA